jgi:UDP-N-acetylglucosamine diphosphorylase / glucose-1-phosphate thymidylyltransferase / UDP-N-acetylgalactosamine diphosphorylase / glucosamine-1-phosphate N-acetyltransferase / galactosamine-1-phosphate N-acetyltransferase
MTRVCLFEDPEVRYLEPLTLTRPAFDLLCGGASLSEWQIRHFRPTEIGALVRPPLAELCCLHHPQFAVNAPAWLSHSGGILVNARWLPAPIPAAEFNSPCVARIDDRVAYIVLPANAALPDSLDAVPECLAYWERLLPHIDARGWMIDFPWDLIEYNGAVLTAYASAADDTQTWAPVAANWAVTGPRERLAVAATARVEPLVAFNTTKGPVIIDRDAVIESFSRLEGPCYIGPESHVLGAKVRGSTVGPACRVGGEVEESIIHGFSNKCHDGFLGHSYVGEWVNLGAGTQTSDLRNDYGPVRITIDGRTVDTGRRKVGSFIGDHTKTGLNSLLNTGSVIGACCNLLPSSSFLPKVIPSYCTVWRGRLQERTDLEELFATAATVMSHRGRQLAAVQHAFLRSLQQTTADYRQRMLGESERRTLRTAFCTG